MKTSFYKKSCRWLVMLVAMFAVSLSGMAQEPDVTFDFRNLNTKVLTVNGVTATFNNYTQGADIWNIYDSYSVLLESESTIAKVEFEGTDAAYGAGAVGASTGILSFNASGTSTWTGSTKSVRFKGLTESTDFYVTTMRIWFEAPAEPTTYYVNFTGQVPSNCYVTLDNQNFSSNGNKEIQANLKKDDLKITTTNDYYADVDYNESTHTYTVEFKHWYIYNVVITAPAGAGDNVALVYGNNYKFSGDQIKEKTPINNDAFSANTYGVSSAYEGNVAVTGEDYLWTVTVTYTMKPAVDYYIVFPEGTPAGTTVSINGNPYSTNDTYSTSYAVYAYDFYINAPEGYWAESTDACYDAESRTFTVKVHEYYHYTVNVTEGVNGAALVNGYTKTNGQKYESQNLLTENEVSVTPVARHDGVFAINGEGHNFTIDVVYTPFPTLNINEAAQDGDGNYWTTFSYNKPVSFPEGVTPCIVTGEEDGVLTIKEFESAMGSETSVFYNCNSFRDNYTIWSGNNNEPKITTDKWCQASYNEFYSSNSEVHLTFTAPEGGVITKVVPTYDNGFGNIEWPDGTINGNYETNVNSFTARWYHPNAQTYVYMWNLTIYYKAAEVPVIPANTGILVMSETPAQNIQYEVKENAENTADVSDNLLVAAGAPDYNWNDASKTYYKFSLNDNDDEGSVGFYWAVDGGHSVTEPTPNKAYLVLDGTANVRGFRLDGKADATEGIFNALNGQEEAGAMFNLNGQRVNGKPAAGVYVKNGRKFIVK